ncbi:MAG: ABC transporter permease [Betaproteobacteria bacterium]|nr:ABC transporter permease [Betaproteobacteria bacterium]
MWRYIFRRFMQGILLVFLVAAIVFFLGRFTGNPADLMLPEDAIEADRVALIEALGLERPMHEQFAIFVRNALRGDLGESIRYRQSAVEVFFSRLPNTLMLIPGVMALALIMAIPLGILSAIRRGGIIDRLSGTLAVLGIATPNFWLGILLIYLFSVQLGWLPSARMGSWQHYVLPTVTLGTFLVAGYMRLIRSSMLEVLDSEFVKLARIKGLSETVVVWKHCLRNALLPVLTLWGVFLSGLVTGAIVTETVFAWPGIGRLTYEAVIFRDYPLLQAVIIMDAVLILFINLLVDILYAYVDPRIRLTN